MLLNVHVKNLALIEDVDVYFGEGLNILSGETGAGKSIIIGSIGIALGAKVPKDIIRKNAEFGLVELLFGINDDEISSKLKDMGIDMSDDSVVISRKIMNGRSIIKINGETVNTALLKDVSGLLLDVHGQHDHESLLRKEKHLDILDSFIGKDGLLIKQNIKEEYSSYLELKRKLSDFEMSDEQRAREQSFLEFEINEIESACLVEGEDEILEKEQKEIANATKLVNALSFVRNAMMEDDNSVTSIISQSARELSKISDINDKTNNLYNCIMDIDSVCQDFCNELADYFDSISFDEERINYVYERLDVINKLKIKHGKTIGDILKKHKEYSEKLEEFKNYEIALNKVLKEISDKEKYITDLSNQLSDIRRKAADMLSKDIVEVLKTLNFDYVDFNIDIEKTSELTSKGTDKIEFMICTNKGEELKPLSQIASGGELSRIMLGIKTILAKVDNIETLIFDEIDTGISGKTAQLVAEKMNIIAKDHQVICITHLPQIAAMADNHYLIEKRVEEDTTKTEIFKLDYESSVMELARMLGGAKITETVISNARELKKIGIE